MSIKHTQTGMIWGYEYPGQVRCQLTWPSPLPPASLASDANTRRLCLAWTASPEVLQVKSGSVTATRLQDGFVFQLDLQPGRFPPGDSGMLSLGSRDCTGYQQYNITASIQLEDPAQALDEEGASSFVGAFFRPFPLDFPNRKLVDSSNR